MAAESPAARIAFVGVGQHATESLFPNIPFIPEFELVALCVRRDERKAEHWAHRYGVPNVYVNVEQMLDEAKPQACCICGPPAMHREVGLQILARGLPIFVEKPPAEDLKGAMELAAAAGAHRTWGQVAFMKRYAPANVLAREYMSSPEFGSLSSITLMHGCGPYDSPARMLQFNGIHMIDLARFLGGDIACLTAYRADGGSGNHALAVSGRFKNGGLVQINQNSGQSWEDCYEAVYATGSRAGLFIDGSRDVEVMAEGRRFTEGKGVRTFGFRARHTVSGNLAFWWAGGHYQRGYWGELSHFARAVLGLERPCPTLDDGVEALRLITAILESAEGGRQVVLS